MKKKAKNKNMMVIVAIAAYLITFIYDLTQGGNLTGSALRMTGSYLLEMLQVMPPVLILTALITIWVPQEVISTNLGAESKWRGKLASVAIGSISAGPIYAAFPVAQTLLHKGASIGNIVIILSSWAVIKLPMLAVEARFLGPRFTFIRYIWTLPSILIISRLTERFVTLQDIPKPEDDQIQMIQQVAKILPGLNCRACGFSSCQEYAEAIAQGKADADACKPGGDAVSASLESLLTSE